MPQKRRATGERMRGPARARSLTRYLAAFAAALALPPLILAAYLTYRYAGAEWRRLEAAANDRNDDLIGDLDRLLTARIAVLQALATSPAIDGSDFVRLDQQARRFVEQGVTMRLRDRGGHVIMDTALPLGAALPQDLPTDWHRQVVATRRPYISDLFVRAFDGRNVVSVSVPVLRDGEVTHVLSSTFSPGLLAQFLTERGAAAPYSVSIVDRTGRIISRSRNHEEWTGRPLPGYASATDRKGTWSGINPDGIAVSAYYSRSELAGWMVTTGIDRRELEGPMRALLWRLFLIAAGLLTLSVGTAALLAHRFSLASTALADTAAAVGAGRLVAAPRTPISEINRIGEAFARASVQLHEQADALERANQDLEQRVARRTAELGASEERYRLLAENSTDVILLYRWSEPIAFASPSCRRLTGFTASELMAMTPAETVHPDDRAAVEAINRALGPDNPSASRILRQRHKDGHWIWVQVTYSFMAEVGAERPDIMAVVRDDTERQSHDLKLRHSNEALQQFSAIVSHDLQAPLRHVNMFADMLQTRIGESDAEAASYARRIMASAERMQRQIRALLVYSQVAYAKVRAEAVPLAQVIAEATTLIDAEIQETGARITLEGTDAGEQPIMSGDPELLVTLFQNLFANALKYRSGDRPVVEVRAERAGAFWQIQVADNGLGIDPQYAERIFEIFRRLHRDESRYPGMGLGLSLCRRIVESHDGEIRLDTHYSHGARFTLTLPRR